MRYTDEQIAEAIHVVNGLLQRWHGDPAPQPEWDRVPDAMRGRVLALQITMVMISGGQE